MSFVGMKWLLDQAINRAGLKKTTEAAGVCDLWTKIITEKFGKNFSQKARAMKFKDGVLIVQTSSAVFSQELELNKQEIIEEINKKMEKNVLKRIQFKI